MYLIIFYFVIFLVERGKGTTYECNINATCGCSSSSTILTRIIGGENAVERSWGWIVSIRKRQSHFCGGSIFSSSFIITAAHCVHDITSLSDITILAGSSTLTPSSSNKFYQIRSIFQITIHPSYATTDTYENDIALIRLSTPLDMTNGYIKPICLPTGTNSEPSDNIDIIAVGWGVTSTSQDISSQNLQQVTIKSIKSTSKDCLKIIDNSQVQFCAGILTTGGKDTCQGDSGGPLVAFVNGLWQLDGITSYGYGCALPGYPGVYTRVSFYIPWITSITQSTQSSVNYFVSTATTKATTQKSITTEQTTTTKKSTVAITTTTMLRIPVTSITATTMNTKTSSKNLIQNSTKETVYLQTQNKTNSYKISMSNLLSYNSFGDPYLQTYFQNKNIQKHLRKIGLINHHDKIISHKQNQSIRNEYSRQEHIPILLPNENGQRVKGLRKSRKTSAINENIKELKERYHSLHLNDYGLLNRSKKTRLNINNNNNCIDQEQFKNLDEQREIPSGLSTKTNDFIRSKSLKINNSCEITMIYLGSQTNFNTNQSEFNLNGYEIIVMQQHCGGENLIVFKNNLKPNKNFTFQSRRHFDYPFALSLYVNDLIDCRISVCCEYKHKIGVPLGGKRASFAFLNIQGGQPCLTCQFNQNSSFFQQKSSNESLRFLNDQIFNHLNTDKLEYDTNNSNENDIFKEAKEMYEKLLIKSQRNVNWKENGYLHSQLGNICKEGLNDYKKSLDHYLISLEILCQYMSPFDIKLKNIYRNIVHILLLQENNQNYLAIKYFQRIIHIDYIENNENECNLIDDHFYLGLLYKNEENYCQALFHLEKSLKYILSKNIQRKNENFDFFEKNYSINETIYDKKAALQDLTNINLSDLHFHLAILYEQMNLKQNALIHKQKALELTIFDQNKFHYYQNYFSKLTKINK
ncbi:unnamed protein product [Adineta steineri]|uniref:Peptidase S1 domain-containing protein n=1 Tax=Adineta steineri TaxID=433720 RepID=A0A814FF00_9BILA|nr:unnamed protein product [Adineta steineri]CAF1133849.1 unnamed protein product [Adineta steineri]